MHGGGIVIALVLLIPMAVFAAFEMETGACLVAGIFILVSPFIGYAELYIASKVTNMFSMTTVWWQAILISLAFGFCLFKAPSSKESESKKTISIPRSSYRPSTSNVAVAVPVTPKTRNVAVAVSSDACRYCETQFTGSEKSCLKCGAPRK